MSLEDLLTEWLPRQRWFAGKDREPRTVSIARRRTLCEGEPSLTHLLVDVELDVAGGAAQRSRYQLLLGARATLPPQLEHARIGHLDDLGDVYDAVHDDELMQHVLHWISDDSDRAGIAFRHEPGAPLAPDTGSRVIGAEQSNTSVVFGDDSILKLFRIVVAGVNPDLEITRALTEAGNEHVAAVHGWIELVGEPDAGATTGDSATAGAATAQATLGVLQEFLKTGSDAWALALTSVRDLFAEGDLHADEVGGDFAAESERLGMATADVHLALSQRLPTGSAHGPELAGLADAMAARLDATLSVVPALRPHAGAITAAFDQLRTLAEPLPVQRVHGDLHLGQVMRTDYGWVLLDFEGEPGAPIETRSALSSPLRDVAGMLRSYDYAARYLLADYSASPHLEYRATEWAERNRDAFCTGYAKLAGHDPRDSQIALQAFELDKAVYEVGYEARNRPDWVSIPMASLERLLAA